MKKWLWKNGHFFNLPQVLSCTEEGMCVGVGGFMFWQILPFISLYVWFLEGFDLYVIYVVLSYIYIYVYIYIYIYI